MQFLGKVSLADKHVIVLDHHDEQSDVVITIILDGSSNPGFTVGEWVYLTLRPATAGMQENCQLRAALAAAQAALVTARAEEREACCKDMCDGCRATVPLQNGVHVPQKDGRLLLRDTIPYLCKAWAILQRPPRHGGDDERQP